MLPPSNSGKASASCISAANGALFSSKNLSIANAVALREAPIVTGAPTGTGSVFAFLSEVSPKLQQSFIDEMGVSKDAVAEVARKFSDLAGYKLPLAI